MEEFNGSYYRCRKCNHIWDFVDDRCPDCGSDNWIDVNSIQVRQEIKKLKAKVKNYEEMLESHDDLKPIVQ